MMTLTPIFALPGVVPAATTTDLLPTLGFRWNDRDFPSSGGARLDVLNVPGMMGGYITGRSYPPGILRVVGTWGDLPGAVNAGLTTHAVAAQRRDALVGIIARRKVIIRFSDLPDREWVGEATEQTVMKFADPQWTARTGNVTLEFMCEDPCARALADVTEVLTNTTTTNLPAARGLGAFTPMRLDVVNGAAAPITRVTLSLTHSSPAVSYNFLQWDGKDPANTASVLPSWVPLGGTLVIDGVTARTTVGGAPAAHGLARGQSYPFVDSQLPTLRARAVVTGGPAQSITLTYRPRFL